MLLPRQRRWRSRPPSGAAPIIGAILLVALTIVAGTVLWTLTFRFPASSDTVTYLANAGLKVPVWGDPTDCTPYGYPQSPASGWSGAEWAAYTYYCVSHQIGNFSTMNATSIVFTSVSPQTIRLDQITVYFLCHNTTPSAQTTVLVTGSLASMTWFPGSSTSPAPNAPHLGYCGTFNANGFGGGAFGTLYNRLCIFTPLHAGDGVLAPGDTFVIYVHTPGSVYDPQVGGFDVDDYHGAPAWCFTTPGACNIEFVAQGNPEQLLANIPIYAISGAGQ
jgi:hypothetical protein